MNVRGELRWFLGNGEFARLSYSEDKVAFSIDQVMVPAAHRGRGIGTRMIERVLALAEHFDKDVHLSARTIDGRASEERLRSLVCFYSRFGFVEVDRGLTVVHMVRRHAQPARNDTVRSLP